MTTPAEFIITSCAHTNAQMKQLREQLADSPKSFNTHLQRAIGGMQTFSALAYETKMGRGIEVVVTNTLNFLFALETENNAKLTHMSIVWG